MTDTQTVESLNTMKRLSLVSRKFPKIERLGFISVSRVAILFVSVS